MGGTSAGAGGIYNNVNLNLYHYGGNNPIKYVDPDGRAVVIAGGAALLVTAAKALLTALILVKIGEAIGKAATAVAEEVNKEAQKQQEGDR